MNSEIIVALIAMFGTALGTFGGIITANKLTNYRIEQLEKKVDKHNSIIERVYKLELNNNFVLEKIDDINIRIEELENEKYKI